MKHRIIVVDHPELAECLNRSDRFDVASLDTQDLLANMVKAATGYQKDQITFVVADSQELETIAPKFAKLISAGYRLIGITGLSKQASGFIYPVTLGAPFSANDLLALMSSLPGVGYIPPLRDGDLLWGEPAGPTPEQAESLWDALDETPPTWTPSLPDPIPSPPAPSADELEPERTEPVLTATSPFRLPWETEDDDEDDPAPIENRVPSPIPGSTLAPSPSPMDDLIPPYHLETSEDSWDLLLKEIEDTPEDEPKGKIIVFAAAKGGPGKSTVSANSAEFLARQIAPLGKKVCLLDANVQQADIATRLGAPPGTPTIAVLAHEPQIDAETIKKAIVRSPNLTMDVILGANAFTAEANPEILNAKLYRKVARALAQIYDYVIVDTPEAKAADLLFLEFFLPLADELIAVLAPDEATLLNCTNFLRFITDPNYIQTKPVDPARISCLLNKAEKDVGLEVDDIRRRFSAWRWAGTLPQLKAWQLANNQARLMVDDPEVAAALTKFWWRASGEPVFDPATHPDRKKGLLARFRR